MGILRARGFKPPLFRENLGLRVTRLFEFGGGLVFARKQFLLKATRPLTPEIFAENPQSKEDGDFNNYEQRLPY